MCGFLAQHHFLCCPTVGTGHGGRVFSCSEEHGQGKWLTCTSAVHSSFLFHFPSLLPPSLTPVPMANSGDQSPYVTAVATRIRTTIPILREGLVRCCHGNNLMTHLLQLLLDAHSLKSYLLNLPSVGAYVAQKAPPPPPVCEGEGWGGGFEGWRESAPSCEVYSKEGAKVSVL